MVWPAFGPSSGSRPSHTPARIAHRRLAERAGGFLDPLFEIRFTAADRPDVGGRLRALQILAASIQLPGCDDDLFLGVDEVVDRAGVAGSGHGLALRQRKFLFEGPDFQKKDIAAPLVRTAAAGDVAGPHIVGNEVAGPYVEILEVHRMADGDVGAAARRHVERNDFFGLAADGIHQLRSMPRSSSACLDILLPAASPSSPRLHDVHFGRPVFHRPNEMSVWRSESFRIAP